MADIPPLVWAHPIDHPYRVGQTLPVTNRTSPYDTLTKPFGGLWTSPATPTGSIWSDWCQGQNMKEGRYDAFLPVLPSPGARVLRIDSHSDLLDALKNYPGPQDWQEDQHLDYEGLASAFDAIWLTRKGRRATFSTDNKNNLHGWDVECVLWLKHDLYTQGDSTN